MTNSAGRLLLENDAPDGDAPTGPLGVPGAAAAAGPGTHQGGAVRCQACKQLCVSLGQTS